MFEKQGKVVIRENNLEIQGGKIRQGKQGCEILHRKYKRDIITVS